VRYVTSGLRPIAHDILAGKCRRFRLSALLCLSDSRVGHEGMIGVRKTVAGADIVPRKGRVVTKEPKLHGSASSEEWTGITLLD
jgi:hypothetical protein